MRRLMGAANLAIMLALTAPAGSETVIAKIPWDFAPGSTRIERAPVGSLLGKAGGKWGWICDEAITAGAPIGAEAPRFAVSMEGTLYAALSFGLAVSRDGGCSWRLAGAPLQGAWVKDVAFDPRA